MLHERSTVLEWSVIIFLLEGLHRFHGANLTLNSDVDQDTQIFGLHERPLTEVLFSSGEIRNGTYWYWFVKGFVTPYQTVT